MCGWKIIRCNHFQFPAPCSQFVNRYGESNRTKNNNIHIPIDSILCLHRTEQKSNQICDDDWKVESQFDGTANHSYSIVWFFVSKVRFFCFSFILLCVFFGYWLVLLNSFLCLFRLTSFVFGDKEFKPCSSYTFLRWTRKFKHRNTAKIDRYFGISGAHKIDYKGRCSIVLHCAIIFKHQPRASKMQTFFWLILASYDRLAHFSMSYFFVSPEKKEPFVSVQHLWFLRWFRFLFRLIHSLYLFLL